MSTATQTEVVVKNHRWAVRFFWCFLIGATTVSLIGNIAHAVLPYLPRVVIQIGAAAVPPIALLAAMHGIALAVRAGASGRVYRWAVSAVAVIGVGAFAVSFLALRDLMRVIGYSSATAWIFPAIIDTAVAVSTMMLVALGDKPERRSRAANTSLVARTQGMQSAAKSPVQSTKPQVKSDALISTEPRTVRAEGIAPVSVQPDLAQTVRESVQFGAAHADADVASDLLASGVTTQPQKTVIAVLAARREGASINAAAKAAGINYRTAQRIVEAAEAGLQGRLAAS
jgi:hypothetical protein